MSSNKSTKIDDAVLIAQIVRARSVWRQTIRIRRNKRIQTESPAERYEGRATFGRQTMTDFSLLGTAAVLSIMFASSTPVQAAIYDSSACPNSSMTSANAPAPSVWLPRGCETSTKPWSAPIGHRQPQAADIPTSISFEQLLDEENTRIDRVISGVCRGC
jgi:hypothetical protein